MVVFVLGRPSKNDYRKFKITNDVNDDYGMMKEVILYISGDIEMEN